MDGGIEGDRPATTAIVSVGEVIRDGLIVLDADDRIRHVNRMACEQLGVGRRELLGVALFEAVAGLDAIGLAAVFESVRADGVERLVEAYLPSLGGWYTAGVSLAGDEMVLVVREVTGHRRVAAQRAIMSELAGGIPAGGGLAELLAALARTVRRELGAATAEVWIRSGPGAAVRSIVTEHVGDDRPERSTDELAALATATAVTAIGPTEVVVTLDLDDERHVLVGLGFDDAALTADAVAVLDELRPHLVSVVARHLAQLELGRLFDLGDELVAIITLDGRFRRINAVAARTLGYTVDELMAMTADEPIHPDDRERTSAAIDELIRTGRTTTSLLNRVRTRDGEYRWIEWYDYFDHDQQLIYATGRDVTERRQLEQQYLRAQRVESLGTLAGGIAHDLNNTLAPIMLASEVLADADLPDELATIVATIATSARRGAEMVRQILTYARGVGGDRVGVDVGALVENVVRVLGDTLPKQITIDLTIDPGGHVVRGDATQLHQVVVNLAVNARDAMPDGGVLSVHVTAVELGAAAAAELGVELAPAAYVTISVADTGTGITAPTLVRLFEPFFSTKPRAEGTGLGLPTSLAIVRSHGGAIGVRSEAGVGSEFTVYLPMASEVELGAGGEPDPPIDRGGGTATVLVVDDERAVRALLAEVLRSAGYTVLEAAGGAEALESLREHRSSVALVLTDVMMPGMDGAALAAAIRERAPELPIVAMTGLDEEATRQRLSEVGVERVLPKPFERGRVLAEVAAALAP